MEDKVVAIQRLAKGADGIWRCEILKPDGTPWPVYEGPQSTFQLPKELSDKLFSKKETTE